MSNKEALHPQGALIQYPDGSQFVYLQAAENLSNGMFVEPNLSGRLIKFRGEVKFPRGICVETVPKEWYSFFMIKEGEQPKKPPITEAPNAS